MWPTLYTEHDLIPLHDESPGKLPAASPPGLLEQWLAAPDAHTLHARIGQALRALGFDWMCLVGVSFADARAPRASRLLASHAHPRWLQTYFAQGLARVDPRVRFAMASRLPLAWSVAQPGSWLDCADPAQRELLERLREADIGSGLIVQVRSAAQPAQPALLSLCARREGTEWMNERVLGRALMFALCLHELCSLHRQPQALPCAAPAEPAPSSEAQAPPSGALASPTRREILRHLALGQSNKQIAYRLQLSADTVKYHLRELRRHFNVRNRIELINSHWQRG